MGKNITILIPINLSFGPVPLFAFTPVTTEIQVESTAGLCSNITKEEQKSKKGRNATLFPAQKLKECISTELEEKKHTEVWISCKNCWT